MRSRTACNLSIVVASLLMLPGCTGGGSDDPVEQYTQFMEQMQAGELSTVYESALPASYQADLNAIVSQVTQLVNEAEFNRIRDLVKTVGTRLAPMLEQLAAKEPAAKPAIAKLQDLPKALGLESYSSFASLDAAALVAKLQSGVLKPVLSTDDAKAKFGKTEMELVESGEGTAKLKVTHTDEKGQTSTEQVTLTKVEGKWVPTEMAAQWKSQMDQAKKSLTALLEEKQANPDLLTKELDKAEAQLKGPMLGMMFGQLMQMVSGQGGGMPPGGMPPGGMPPGGMPPGGAPPNIPQATR